MVMFALGGIAVSTWGPRLPSIRDSLHLGVGVVGLVLGGVTVGSIAGLGASSALLSFLGPRRAICGALLQIAAGIAVIGLGAGLVVSLPVTVAGFVLVGFGIGALDVMINVQGAAVETAAGKTLMPLLHASWSVGAILGSGIGALAAGLGIDFLWQFLAEAILVAVSAIVSVRFLPNPVDIETAGDKAPAAVRVRQWLHGWGDRRLLMIGLVMLGVELGEGTSNSRPMPPLPCSSPRSQSARQSPGWPGGR